jgi:DNA-binding YbaB/EbfC family protein
LQAPKQLLGPNTEENNMQQPDLNKMMREVQQMQQAMIKLQADLANMNVDGTAGGGAITVTCSAALEFKTVKIKPEAVDPSDVETLEDLVLAAIQDACEKAKNLGEQKMKQSGIAPPPGLGF